MSSAPPIPLIAIVGRPNVGKSTLFNRYAGHRRALVENLPGITRDRIAEEIEVEGRRVLLVDTAGLDRPVGRAQGNERGELDQAVQAQARAAVADADAVLFVVDGQAGLLPEDEAIAKTLRRTQKPLLIAVNKVDVPAHRDRIVEFHQLGMEPVCGVSAEHGTGAFDALECLVAKLPPPAEGEGEEQEAGVRIALVGRPNVGKSSLTNRLLGEDRVVVSEVPGTTRDAVDIRFEIEGRPFVLVDTAGLRRPGRRTRTAERGSALMTVRAVERAQVVLVLIDAHEGFTDQDAAVANLVRERGRAAVLLANKWDLVAGEEADRLRESIEHGIRFMSDTPILGISAKTGLHLNRVLDTALKVLASASREIPTAELNRWLEETVRKHEPSLARKGQKRRRPLKFFYATQTGTCPPTFVLFCTEPQAIQTSYKRFLENQLRAAFGFEGSPIRIRLRARNERA